MTGRRRYFPEFLRGGSPRDISSAERAAINHPIQGLEGDIIKIAMLHVKDELEQKKLWRKDVFLLLSIHDELLFEVKDDLLSSVKNMLAPVLEQALPELSVPLVVESKSGKDWGSMKR